MPHNPATGALLRQATNSLLITGLAATPTGSVNTTVAVFAGAPAITNQTVRGGTGIAEWATLLNTAADGFSCKLARRGKYIVVATVALAASADIVAGISVDGGVLTGVPTFGLVNGGVYDSGTALLAASTAGVMKLVAEVDTSQRSAADATSSIVRLQIAASGGGAPTAAHLTLAQCAIQISRAADCQEAS